MAFTLAVIGPGHVGKTALISCLRGLEVIEGRNPDNYLVETWPLGHSLHHLKNKPEFILQDTSSSFDYIEFTKYLIGSAQMVALVCDVSAKYGLIEIDTIWPNLIEDYPHIPFILIANKKDKKQVISNKALLEFAKRHSFIAFMTVSATKKKLYAYKALTEKAPNTPLTVNLIDAFRSFACNDNETEKSEANEPKEKSRFKPFIIKVVNCIKKKLSILSTPPCKSQNPTVVEKLSSSSIATLSKLGPEEKESTPVTTVVPNKPTSSLPIPLKTIKPTSPDQRPCPYRYY